MTNILTIIPARGDSKRLPGKNIKLLDKRPLIAYSILLAKSLEKVNNVVAASDSPEILATCTYDHEYLTWYGMCSSYQLPADLCTDDATLSGTLAEVVNWYLGFEPVDWVILLQPTCPLRLPSLCNRWIDQDLMTQTATDS